MSGKDLFGQASPGKIPNGIAIQSVARDASGNAAANRNIYLKVELKQDAKTGESVLLETHSVISNDEGIFNFYIGQGVRLSGISSLIFLDWKGKIYFLNIKMAISPSIPTPGWDLEKEYVDLGTEQIWSVPYAFTSYRSVIADSATSIAGILPGSQGGTGQANVGRSIILGGDLEIKGTGNLIFQTSGASTIELPTSGKMVTTTSADTLFNKSIMSPLLLGIPKSITPNVSSNDNSIATTNFVNVLLASDSNSINKKISQFENSSKDSIDKKLNIRDTSEMLSPYALKFKQDHVLNGVSIGKYSDGDTILTAGKSLDQFLNDLITKTILPSYTNPSATIGIIGTNSFEIGTRMDLLPDINLNYTFNKADAGIEVTPSTAIFYKNGVSLGAGVTSDAAAGTVSGATRILTTSINYTVQNISYTDGAIKNDNLGNPYPTGKIAAGAINGSNTASITTFQYSYYGPSTTSVVADYFKSTLKSAGKSQTLTFSSLVNEYIFYAYPSALGNLTSIKIGGFESIDAFNRTSVSLINAQGYSMPYYVYVSQNYFNGTQTGIVFQ